jgi:hypothetical protein
LQIKDFKPNPLSAGHISIPSEPVAAASDDITLAGEFSFTNQKNLTSFYK